ncbi:hypothetical protein RND81_10G155800 [Saponaria officinalis]|uniref:Uncharacterized protein n=1 Tax=Saponaria officinalis TaxID=3572 RepID=A0AAW1I3A3_SAPOF
MHTMFNLDLRALPSTTKFTTSKLKLGHNRGIIAPAEYDEEKVIDFDLGTTPGGKILPGTRFVISAQPFSGPILFPQGYQGFQQEEENHNDEGEGMGVDGMGENIGQTGDGTYAQGGVNAMDTELDQDQAQVNGTTNVANQTEENRVGDTGMGFSVSNPFEGANGHGESEYLYNYDLNVQKAIRIRIEEDLIICRAVDDQRGYNQCFYL